MSTTTSCLKTPSTSAALKTMTERHFKPKELAQLWGFSPDTIRSWFESEAGVLIEDRPEQMHKRGYRSMRIPESTAKRVYEQHLTKACG